MDFVIIDMEHGSHSFSEVENMIRAAEVEGCTPLVRVAKNDESLVLRALDVDAHGVVVPHIESKIDAQNAVKFSKYFPLGQRGFSPFTRAGRYSLKRVAGHSELQNEQTIIVLILEGKEGINNLDDILGIECIESKIDVIYVGAYDLSQALGLPGQVDHPEVKKLLAECIMKIRLRGLAAGGHVAKNKTDIEWMCEMGMQFITLLPECAILANACENLYADFSAVKSKFSKL
jgi:4-hydroxy-2-oxoheptanedioate aldolase